MKFVMKIETPPDLHRSGWWKLREAVGGNAAGIVELPTFMIPADAKIGDRVTIERAGSRPEGYWRVTKVVRPVRRAYGSRR